MIFGALSNTVYRVSLYGPGAELDGGGVQTPPAARRVRRQAAARRGLRWASMADMSMVVIMGKNMSTIHDYGCHNGKKICPPCHFI